MQLLHRQAAAVALRLERENEQAYESARLLAEAADTAAMEQVKRAQELQAAAEKQMIEAEAAAKEHAALREKLRSHQAAFRHVHGRNPTKADWKRLSYEYRKAMERYHQLKDQYPGIKPRTRSS